MTVLSTALGVAAPLLLPRSLTHWAGACLFLFYGVTMLLKAYRMPAAGEGPSEELGEVEDELKARPSRLLLCRLSHAPERGRAPQVRRTLQVPAAGAGADVRDDLPGRVGRPQPDRHHQHGRRLQCAGHLRRGQRGPRHSHRAGRAGRAPHGGQDQRAQHGLCRRRNLSALRHPGMPGRCAPLPLLVEAARSSRAASLEQTLPRTSPRTRCLLS